MRGMLVALAVAGMLAPATAQTITADGIARSASLMRQIAEACADQFDVDRDMARRYERTFVEAGEKAFGKKNFARTLSKEYIRRAGEVADAGAAAWCADQRDRVIGMGGESLFRK